MAGQAMNRVAAWVDSVTYRDGEEDLYEHPVDRFLAWAVPEGMIMLLGGALLAGCALFLVWAVGAFI